jgi:hypothetical protein
MAEIAGAGPNFRLAGHQACDRAFDSGPGSKPGVSSLHVQNHPDARPASTVVHPQRGAQHIRELTALYSSMIAADGNLNSYPNPNSYCGEHARVSKRALPLQL